MKKMFPRIAGLVAGLFFLPSAFATTFGPIPVVQQAEDAQYIVRGVVESAGTPHYPPHITHAYTYWRFHVTAQPLGNPLPPVIMVREAGGEIGDYGYHVAGSAEFNAGEEDFIVLRDTDESPNVKEVSGLSSGKYRVETAPNGRKIVVSGLGLPVTGSDGVAFSPEEFHALVNRVARKETTPADRNIFVNRNPMHEHGDKEDPTLQAGIKQAEEMLKRRPAEAATTNTDSNSASKDVAAKPLESQPKSLTESAPAAEENLKDSSSWGWIALAVAGAVLLLGLFLFFRR